MPANPTSSSTPSKSVALARGPVAAPPDAATGAPSKSQTLASSPLSAQVDTGRISPDGPQRPRNASTATLTSIGKPMPANPTHHAVRQSPIPVPDFAESRDTFGLDQAGFDRFKEATGAFYAKSASAGANLNSLNDHDGILVVPARDGEDSKAEYFAVVKDNGRFYIKAQADRAINFADFEKVLHRLSLYDPAQAALRREELKGEIQKALGCEPWEVPMQETLVLSEMLALALPSQLTFRRDVKESDEKLMSVPLNPTEFPKGASWANSENALCPGCGPVLRNGTRRYQFDWNRVEKRLMGFKNTKGDVTREDAAMSSHVPGQKAPVLVEGPVLFELAGIKRWQLMGPSSEQSGVQGGSLGRAANAAMQVLAGDAEDMPAAMEQLRPGAHIRITTDDDAVHDLKMTDTSFSLTLATPTVGRFGGDETGAFGVGMNVERSGTVIPLAASHPAREQRGAGYTRQVQADVNAYSYQGHNNGRHGSSSGLPDPRLILSTGEALKAGPLLNRGGSLASLADAAGRVLLYQPALGGQGRGGWARLANVGILAASKFGTTAISAKVDMATRGPGGTHVEGANTFSGVGAGHARPGLVAGSTAAIVVAQEAVTAIKEAVLPAIPENWKKPDNIYARNLVNFTFGWAEEMARLEINLGIQQALGLRAGTPLDHGTLAISSGIKAGLEVLKDNIGGREANPYAHLAIDAAEAMQYMLARVTGMALSEDKPGPAGRLADFKEALATRVNLRLYDQVLAPAFTHVLNANGLLGPHAGAFDNQVARERMVQHLGAKLMGGVMAAAGGDLGPLDEMIADKNLVATIRAQLDELLVGGRDPGETEFYSATDLTREHVKHSLNRTSLAFEDGQAFCRMLGAAFQPLVDKLRPPHPLDDLEAGNPDHRVARAIQLQPLVAPTPEGLRRRANATTHMEATIDAQDKRIAGALAYASGRSLLRAHEARPTTNSLDEASRAQQDFVAAQNAQLMGRHSGLQSNFNGEFQLGRTYPATLGGVVPQPVGLDYAQRARPAASGRSTLGVPPVLRQTGGIGAGVPVDEVPRQVGTFSAKLQAAALPEHLPMTRAAGMSDLVEPHRVRAARHHVKELVTAHRVTTPAAAGRFSPPRPINQKVKDRINQAVRDYTVESQFFHYPLRWPVTGQPMVLKIVPGVELSYNVLNKTGNIKGAEHMRVDPIEALYANLGCARAEKFPADLLRAVVTEAAYRNEDPANPKEASGVLQTGGSKGVLTEIFSASASARVAAQFNLPISGFGAATKDRSQRIDLVQQTGVNIADMTDLAQAEVIMMPGAMFTIKYVDKNAGKPPADTTEMRAGYRRAVDYLAGRTSQPPKDGELVADEVGRRFLRFKRAPAAGDQVYDPGTQSFSAFDETRPMPKGALVSDAGPVQPQDIGQVVYMESVDTYALERAHDNAVAHLLGKPGATRPPEGEPSVEPDTGQFLRFTSTPTKNDQVYDSKTKGFSKYEGTSPPSKGVLVFESATKNYFLGRPLEFDSLADKEALWRHPYAGHGAKRTTKDAIHAAIVRGDEIVEHLDEAIKNLHHEHYRREGGFYDTEDDGSGQLRYKNPRARAEAARLRKTKDDAAVIAARLDSADFGQALSDGDAEMLAWITASYLRTPIKLVPVNDYTGLPAEGVSIHETYDKVDLLKHPLERKPPPAVLIGVGADGYYAMRHDGQFQRAHKIGGQSAGKSAETFMLAFLRAGPLDKDHFELAQPNPSGGTPAVTPDRFANHSASQLHGKLCAFAKTDYIVLQEALVKRDRIATNRAPTAGRGAIGMKNAAVANPRTALR